MRTVVLTSDKHAWLLKGFLHQWQKYGAMLAGDGKDFLRVEVAGFAHPDFLPDNIPFCSIGKLEDFPIRHWSDALIRYLEFLEDDLVLLLLEDYWMLRPVNHMAVWDAMRFMQENEDVIRFDLAADRMFSRGARFAGAYRNIDLCQGGEDYSLSFQASIYRRELLLQMLHVGETPWEAELNGTGRLNRTPYRVLGTYNWPMNYMIVMNKGQFDRQGLWMFPARTLSNWDWQELDALGYCREPEMVNEHTL